MALFAVLGALLLTVAMILREVQLGKERAAQAQAFALLREALRDSQARTKRVAEDLLVLQRLLEEKRLLDAEELITARLRLIDQPRRVAAERHALTTAHNLAPNQLIIDEDASKVH